MKNDPDFVHAVNVAAIENDLAYQEHQLDLLDKYFLPKSSSLKEHPFKKLIMQSIPIRMIKADTLRILWHQHLGHPRDEYLYSAHNFIGSVPKFKKISDSLSCCLVCIQAKQTKTAPRHNLTWRAVHFGQGLSIDFAFSGVMSKNRKRREDYIGINGETYWILVTNHFTRIQFGATNQESLPS